MAKQDANAPAADELLRMQRDLCISLGETREMEDALRKVLTAALTIEGVDCGGVYVVEEETGVLRLLVHEGLPPSFVENASAYQPDSPHAKRVAEGMPLYGTYQELASDKQHAIRHKEIRAIAILPVLDGKEAVAVLNVGSYTSDSFSMVARAALEAIAARIGGVLTQVRSRSELERRDAILEAVYLAVGRFLRERTLDKAGIEKVLEALGRAVHVSRVYVFENGSREDGTLVTTQRYEWNADGVASQVNNPDVQGLPWDQGGMGRWKTILEAGQSVVGNVNTFPGSERAILEPQGILSVLAMPVTVEGVWWGFIGFDECKQERTWSQAELRALEVAATMFGALVERRHHEVSGQAEAQSALACSEENYRTLVERSIQGLVVIQDGKIVFTNSAFAELSGYTVEELLSLGPQRVQGLIHPEDQELVWGRLRQRMQGKTIPSMYEVRGVRKDGKVIALQMLANLIQFEGKPAVQGAFIDITEKKRMEEDLHRAQKLESIGVLAGGIAHDFNNLLLAILGNISLARMDVQQSEETDKMLLAAEKACGRAQALTQQLLTFSKGGSPVRKAEDVAEIVRESASFALSGSKSRPQFDISEDLWICEVDKGQIGQVISNVVINADQAMPEGGVVEVSARNVKQEEGSLPGSGRYVEIRIGDRGIGIPEEHMSRIFDPYFSTKQRGNGLGLAVAHSIIAKHQGYVSVESGLGQGSTFRICLPASEQVHAAGPEQHAAGAGSGQRILLMDDEPLVRKVAGDTLAHGGYQATLVPNGEEALEQYRQAMQAGQPFDLVILDLTIKGGMGGLETLKGLRAMDENVRAVVSSGYSNDPILADPRAHGFCGVAAKPYHPNDLLDVVAKALT